MGIQDSSWRVTRFRSSRTDFFSSFLILDFRICPGRSSAPDRDRRAVMVVAKAVRGVRVAEEIASAHSVGAASNSAMTR
jgi:hypothetical protein